MKSYIVTLLIVLSLAWYAYNQLELKEAQIISLKTQVEKLNEEIQTQVVKQNEEIQKFQNKVIESQQLQQEKVRVEAESKRLSKENERLITDINDLKNIKNEDTEYVVIRREYIPGKLIDKTPPRYETSSDNPYQTRSSPVTIFGQKVYERIDPVWRIYVKGVQTKREYPGIEVKESAYKNFFEGATYVRADLMEAKVR